MQMMTSWLESYIAGGSAIFIETDQDSMRSMDLPIHMFNAVHAVHYSRVELCYMSKQNLSYTKKKLFTNCLTLQPTISLITCTGVASV